MKKGIICTALLLVLLLVCITTLPTEAQAATITNSGTCGDNLTWTLDDTGTLTISGTGAMTNYTSSSNVPWYSSRSSVKKVVIDNSVTIIGNYAFYYCYNLTEITIPDSVTSIGYRAFYSCDNLTSVTIPDSVTSIGSGAFCYCTSLTSITIPDSVTSIGSDAFYGCKSLSYNQYMTVKYLGNAQNPYLLLVGATSTNIVQYRIHTKTKFISDDAFRNCTSLTKLIIPDSVTSIGERAFYGCTSLTEIRVDANNPSYSSDSYGVLFNKDRTALIQAPGALQGYYIIPDSVTGIGDDAFRGCDSLTSITIPDSVTSIGSSAFRDCTSLTSVNIPDSVTSISGAAFYNCTGLTNITIPDSVTSISDSAFSNCSSLTSIDVDAQNAVYHSAGNCLIETASKTLILGCQNSEIPTDGSVTSIGDNAFSSCTNLTSIAIPDSVTSIGGSAFWCCTSLTSVTIPNSVTSIGEWAFRDCTSLTSVTIGNGVTEIGMRMFDSCRRLTSIAIPDSVTSISMWAFNWCTSLTSITIPNSVTSISTMAFGECDSLQRVYYKGSQAEWEAISIGDENGALRNATVVYNYEGGCVHSTMDGICTLCGKYGICGDNLTWTLDDAGTLTISGTGPMANYNGLGIESSPWVKNNIRFTRVIIADGVTSIGDYAFATTHLTSIHIPASVTSIGSSAFYWCSSLTSITIPSGVTSVATDALYRCTALTGIWVDADNLNYSSDAYGVLFDKNKTKLIQAPGALQGEYVIPDSVTDIGAGAFGYCDSLTNVTIPDSVTSIGNSAFRDCHSLTSITIPANVTNIGSSAFYRCDGLTSVTIPDSVTSIGSSAFEYCDSLSSITIPDSVTSIGNWAFSGCTSLLYNAYYNVKYLGNTNNPYVALIETVSDTITQCNIHPHTKIIGDSAFEDCDSLTSVTIPDSVTSIGNSAFEDCDSLTSVTIGNGVTSIGYWAFGDCTSLTSITIPNSVTSIGVRAFYNCDSLTNITIPDSVTSIGDGAFYDCGSLTTVTIPNGVTSIGRYAFDGCYNLTSVTIPDSVTSIGDEAFDDCDSLRNVVYTGLCSDWENVQIGEYNDSLRNATIEYAEHNFNSGVVTREPTCVEKGVMTYTCSCGAVQTVDIPTIATNHYVLQGDRVTVDSYTTKNNSNYPFVLQNGWYASTNQTVSGTTSAFEIHALYDCTLVLKYKVSSESGCDKLIIKHNSTTKDTISGSVSEKTMTLTLVAGDVVYIQYTKDGSVNRDSDTGWFKIDSCTQTVIVVRVPTEDIEPTCTAGVVCDGCNEIVKPALGHTAGEPVKENETDGTYELVTYCVTCKAEISRETVTTHTHALTKVEAKEPTYSTAGNTAYYICECGKYFSDAAGENEIAEGSWVIAALAAGKDTTALAIKPTASNTPATLMLGADLKLNFNVAVKTTTAYDSIFLEITKLGVTTEVALYSKNSTNHTFRYTLAAPEMTAEMEVVVCGEKNGKVYVGDPVTLTYKDIILSKLDSFYASYNTDEQSKAGCHLLVNLLKYGEEAQKRFNISTDNLATAGLSNTYKAMINTAAPALDTWTAPATGTYYLRSYTPMLQEQIKIAFTFAVPSYTSLEGYEVRIVQTKSTGVVTHTFGADVLKNTSSTRIRCDFAIAGAEGRDNLAITLYKDGAAVSTTVNTNLSALSQGKQSDALNPLLYAMMNYCDAAKAYFG